MLDKSNKINFDHLASLPNIQFHKMNVKDPKFTSFIKEKAAGNICTSQLSLLSGFCMCCVFLLTGWRHAQASCLVFTCVDF